MRCRPNRRTVQNVKLDYVFVMSIWCSHSTESFLNVGHTLRCTVIGQGPHIIKCKYLCLSMYTSTVHWTTWGRHRFFFFKGWSVEFNYFLLHYDDQIKVVYNRHIKGVKTHRTPITSHRAVTWRGQIVIGLSMRKLTSGLPVVPIHISWGSRQRSACVFPIFCTYF